MKKIWIEREEGVRKSSKNEEKRMEEIMRRVGIQEVEKKMEKLERYIERVIQRKKWAGTISEKGKREIRKKITESIMVLEEIKNRKGKQVVEIGSGGGLLGIVIAILCPEMNLTMVESLGRKAAFLAETAGELELRNVSVVMSRAEKLAGEREYDIALSRASGRLEEKAPIALKLLRSGGRYIALKGRDVDEEIQQSLSAIEKAGGSMVGVVRPEHPSELGPPGNISLVVVEKI